MARSAIRVYRPYLIYKNISWSVPLERSEAYLSEVGRSRVKVNLLINLVVPGQRVHDNHVRLGSLQQLVVNDERILHGLVGGDIREALLLHTSAVHDVR